MDSKEIVSCIVNAEAAEGQRVFLEGQGIVSGLGYSYENFTVGDLISLIGVSSAGSGDICDSPLYLDWVKGGRNADLDEAIFYLAQNPHAVIEKIIKMAAHGGDGYGEIIASIATSSEKEVGREILLVPVAYLSREGREHLLRVGKSWDIFPIRTKGWGLFTAYIPKSRMSEFENVRDAFNLY